VIYGDELLNEMKTKIIIGLMGLFSIFGCSTTTYKPGDIFSVDDGEGRIGIVKVLVVEPEVIHLRIYKNKFSNRPKTIEIKELSLGRLGDKDGFGIGHIPMDIDGFKNWKPEWITSSKVTKEELEGYNIWKESQ
jgi:hypothetical protein